MSLSTKKCVPCEGGIEPLSNEEIDSYIKEIEGWQLSDSAKSIKKDFKFSNFAQALEFTNKVGQIAEEQNHHPDIELGWGYCNVTLLTHAIGGLHENDFIVAAQINEIQ